MSASWRAARRVPSARGLQAESVLLLGGLRALLLQLAHPAVGHGVAEHSDFATDPLARLWGTLSYVYVVAEGEPDLVRAVAGHVGRLHAAVVSEPGSRPEYDARNADLQFWVAATLHDTALRIADGVWGPLPPALADELLLRMGRIGTALGMPDDRWPRDTPAFRRAFAAAEVDLAFDDTTLDVVRSLFRAGAAPLWVRVALPFLVAATLPTLPGLRDALRPLAPRHVPDLTPLGRALVPLYRALPAGLRRLPARRILAAAERRFSTGAAARTGGTVPRT